MALNLLISAKDLASVVVTDMAATYDNSLVSMGDSTLMLNEYLASLDDQLFTTGVGFDGLSASADATDGSLASLDEVLATVDATAASTGASLDTLAGSAVAVDESLASVGATAASTDAALVSTAASATTAGASLAAAASSTETMAASAHHATAAIGALLVVVVALAAIGIGSIKMAADYQQGMDKVQALTGASTQQMTQYDESLKHLAVTAGVAPKALTDGLYNVLSASYKGADAINVLTLATEDSKIGMTDATTTTDALTNVLRTFGTTSGDITAMNGQMLETVTLGKASFAQYAQAIVKAASSAKQFHETSASMNAAWATMTSSGIRAAQASTDYQQSLKVMDGNVGTLTKSLTKSGIAFDEAKFNSMDYGHKVVYLNSALQQANMLHVKVTGVTIQAAQAISTISNHIGDYNANLAILSDKQAMAQKTQQAWLITQGGLNESMDRLKATFDVLMISIGDQFLPLVTQLTNVVTPLVQSFADWVTKSGFLQSAASGLALALKQIEDAFTAVTTPIAQFKTVVAPLLDDIDRASGYFKPMVQSVNLMSDAFDRGMGAVAPFTPGINLMTDAVDRGSGAFANVVTTVNPFVDIFTQLQPVIADIVSIFGEIGAIIPPLVGKFETFTSGILDAFVKSDALQAVIHAVKDILPQVGTFLLSVGDSINTNLLPPLESLVTNVGGAVANFVNWADTSGATQTALDTLGGVVSVTTQVLGPLITAIADTVGWLGGGGAGTNTLIFVLSAVATAFLLLKIADTTAQFGQFFAKISEGDGIVANLADAMKSKLGKAFDDFLTNQAPNFKQSLADMKLQSADTAIAEGEIGTAAETSAAEVSASTATMDSEYVQLSLVADEAGTSVGAIGTDAQIAAGEVAASSAEMDAGMATIEGSSVAAGGAMAGIGAGALAAAAALGTMAAMAGGIALLAAQLYIVKGVVIDGAPSIENGPSHIVGYSGGKSFGSPTAQAEWKAQTDAMKAQAASLADSVSGSVKLMDGNVVRSLDEMHVKSYSNMNAFTSDTMRMFANMGDYGTQQMQSLDKNTIGYWNDIAAYIAGHPINANVNTSVGSTYSKLSGGLQKNYYASGVLNAPAGWAMVGENGPELMQLQGGENIYSHAQTMDMVSGGGANGSRGASAGNAFGISGSQTIIVQVQPATASVNLDGRKVGESVMTYAAKEVRLQSAVRNK